MPGSIPSVYQEYFHPDAEFSHYDVEVAKVELAKVGFKSSNRSGN